LVIKVPIAVYEGSPDSLQVGLALFAVGIVGNLYHHYLLSAQRSSATTKYVIPTGAVTR
jgi:hypothetical protein